MPSESLPGHLPTAVRVAESADLPRVQRLFAENLPELTFAGVSSWETLRGSGSTYAENLMLAALVDGRVVGAALAGPALLQDHGLDLPWWAVDAVAVDPKYRNRGLGRLLLECVRGSAFDAGVTSLYGLCKAELRPWYEGLGFATTAPDACLDSNVPMGHGQTLSMSTDDGNCWFLANLSEGAQLCLPETPAYPLPTPLRP